MTADSSTATVTYSGDGGIDSPSRRRSLPSAWAQVVRGSGEPESVIPRSPRDSEQHSVFSDQLLVFEPAPVVVAAAAQPDGSDCGAKKTAWNKPSANGVVEGIITATTTTPVMGAASWPALSESTRSVPKSLSSSESSSKPTSDGLLPVLEASVISQTQQKPAKTNANNHSNTTNNHHPVRQRSMKRGGSVSAGYSRPPPPPPPPLPPPFPLFDMTYCNYVPPVLDAPVREQPPLKGNSWNPRPMGVVHNHSSNRTPSRRNNFGPRPRGDGGGHNNGYGGRNEHHDRHGTRSPSGRDVHVPQQIVPPPPRGYFRQPHPGGPYIAAQSIRPYGNLMGYEMAAPFLYVPTLPPEPYRSTPLLSQATPRPMFIPVMDPSLHDLILNQIEYYFSDANLVKDNFLRSNMDEEGWVSIALIAGFRRVQNLTTDVQIILNSLRDSSSVEVQGDKVRRRIEWRKWIQSADFSADSTSQSSCETINCAVEEVSIQKLKLDEFATEDAISDLIEDVDHKEAPELTESSNNLANGEVSPI